MIPFWPYVASSVYVSVRVSVYVCLYAEWIKKLLINLIKSKSSVNTTHTGPGRQSGQQQQISMRHWMRSVEWKGGGRGEGALGTRTYAKSLMQVVKKKISNFLTACPASVRHTNSHELNWHPKCFFFFFSAASSFLTLPSPPLSSLFLLAVLFLPMFLLFAQSKA